jgi:hypothetical protein
VCLPPWTQRGEEQHSHEGEGAGDPIRTTGKKPGILNTLSVKLNIHVAEIVSMNCCFEELMRLLWVKNNETVHQYPVGLSSKRIIQNAWEIGGDNATTVERM